MKKLTDRIFIDEEGMRYKLKWVDWRETQTVFGDRVLMPYKLIRIYLDGDE